MIADLGPGDESAAKVLPRAAMRGHGSPTGRRGRHRRPVESHWLGIHQLTIAATVRPYPFIVSPLATRLAFVLKLNAP